MIAPILFGMISLIYLKWDKILPLLAVSSQPTIMLIENVLGLNYLISRSSQ